MPLLHDVATTAIINPPPGITLTGDYDVIGHIRNFGSSSETFDVTATVYDTTNGWAEVFSQTVTFINFPAGYDSVCNFGIVTFNDSTVYNTQIYTQLGGDQNSNNDTASIYSKALPKIWYFGPSMTYARHGLDVVDYQGKIYAIGGSSSTRLEVLENDVWSELAPLPQGQAFLAAAIVGNKIYTMGSYGASNITQIYDIGTDSWSSGPDLPQGLYWATAEAAGDSIYLIGGYAGSGGLKTLYILNTATNTWSQGADMPSGIQIPASALYNNQIYVFRPYFKYDIGTDSWTTFPGPPSGHGKGAEAVTVGDKIYLIGGNAGYIYEAYNTVEIYDPITETWEPSNVALELNIGRYQFGATYANEKIYAIGGRDSTATSINSVEISDIDVGVEQVTKSDVKVQRLEFYPNPFRNRAVINYNIAHDSKYVELKIYDISGKLVRTLINKTMSAGSHTVIWNGRDSKGTSVVNGIYFIKLQAGDFSATRKITLLR